MFRILFSFFVFLFVGAELVHAQPLNLTLTGPSSVDLKRTRTKEKRFEESISTSLQAVPENKKMGDYSERLSSFEKNTLVTSPLMPARERKGNVHPPLLDRDDTHAAR